MDFQDKVAKDWDRYFLAVDLQATVKSKFFKRQPPGKNIFLLVVKICWADENKKDSGTKARVTMHWLREELRLQYCLKLAILSH